MTMSPRADTEPSIRQLVTDLKTRVEGEVRFDAGTRAAYSTDASNYRQVPIGVVVPFGIDDAVEAIAVCREHDVPVLARGAGTSLAGQCCNVAVVLDFSKYCHDLTELDVDARTALLEPGAVLDDVNRVLAPHGLVIGPQPATHSSCTIGGMIGNNSCGATAQAYGKMGDSIIEMEVLTYNGTRMWVGPTDDERYAEIAARDDDTARLYRATRDIRDRYLGDIRTGFPAIPRRVSGYNLDALLPENGFDVAAALAGSENTLVTILRARVKLFALRPHRSLVVLGFDDLVAAAELVPLINAHQPVAVEGIDGNLVRLQRAAGLAPESLERLPAGNGWLLVRFDGDSHARVRDAAEGLIDDVAGGVNPPTTSYLDDPAEQDAMWRVRELALGAGAYPPHEPVTHEGWEDAAVAPEKLADYLRDYYALQREFGFESATVYGHFGHGCVHTRIPFDLLTAEGIETFREFVERAAQLVVSHGGSLSGEHGDGQSRGELLGLMFPAAVMRAFGEFKDVFDPTDRMNPGKLVRPYPLDENLRHGVSYHPAEPATHFAYPLEEFRFSQAASRCVGVGNCRNTDGGVMCPSYRATGEEQHSTRGRSRLLFEMMNGEVITDGWRSEQVRDALDLCLSCKGCKSECPVNVDMATYKAEFLSHHYAGRLRPASHYSMGWIPLWARLAAAAPRLANATTAIAAIAALRPMLTTMAGLTSQREIPRFAPRRFTDWFHGRHHRPVRRPRVVLWPDTFYNNFHPNVAVAAWEVLSDAGFDVVMPPQTVCCGLTWISTGQLSTAKRVLRRTLRVLAPALRAGTPIVVLEPSCATVFRSDMPDLLYGDTDAARLSRQTHTLAEFLRDFAPNWLPPSVDISAMVQYHCHQQSVLGYDADQRLMDRCGIDSEVLDAGCCGLAGNFGFEREHYDVSMAVAEHGLLPAVRGKDPDTFVLTDGFSCRTQLAQADTGTSAWHLAEILAAALPAKYPPEFAVRTPTLATTQAALTHGRVPESSRPLE